MGAQGVSPEERDQAVSMMRDVLIHGYDQESADSMARQAEEDAYNQTANREQWLHRVRLRQHAITQKFQQRMVRQQQQPMFIPPPHMMMMMQPPQQQQQPMVAMPPSMPQFQVPIQYPGGMPFIPPQQMMMQMPMQGVAPIPYPPMQQPPINNINQTMGARVQLPPPPVAPQQQQQQQPQAVNNNGVGAIDNTSSLEEKKKAHEEFRKLQLACRQSLLGKLKTALEEVEKTAEGKEPSKGRTVAIQMFRKTIALTEVEDLSTLPHEVTTEEVKMLAALIDNSKQLADKCSQWNEVQKKQAELAGNQSAAQTKNRKDPTEMLLEILNRKPEPTLSPLVAAALSAFDSSTQNSIFPLPRLYSTQ